MGYLPKFLLSGVALSAMPFASPQANAPRRQDNIGLTGTFFSCVSPIDNETCYGNGTHYQMGDDLYADIGNNTMKFLYSGAPLLPKTEAPLLPKTDEYNWPIPGIFGVSALAICNIVIVAKIFKDRYKDFYYEQNDQANNAPGDIAMHIVGDFVVNDVNNFRGTAPAVVSNRGYIPSANWTPRVLNPFINASIGSASNTRIGQQPSDTSSQIGPSPLERTLHTQLAPRFDLSPSSSSSSSNSPRSELSSTEVAQVVSGSQSRDRLV